ncbi:hypothetical protein [Mycobacterium sp.]|uniref:hypothetical protein n=1 Tax=Mycobacterium sp. TaxID=1785 RepID=UPI0025DBD01D|nr:hypothetical protein [Mycobacterium sp.]
MTITTQADVERIMIDRDISFHFQPLVAEQEDGSWTAAYPGADWNVTGATADEARAQLRAEELQRIGTAEAASWKVNAVRQHIEQGPIPGVYELDNAAADDAIAAGTTAAMNAAIAALGHG